MVYSIDPKSGHRFLDKLMDRKETYTQNTGKFGVLSIGKKLDPSVKPKDGAR